MLHHPVPWPNPNLHPFRLFTKSAAVLNVTSRAGKCWSTTIPTTMCRERNHRSRILGFVNGANSTLTPSMASRGPVPLGRQRRWVLIRILIFDRKSRRRRQLLSSACLCASTYLMTIPYRCISCQIYRRTEFGSTVPTRPVRSCRPSFGCSCSTLPSQ